MDVQITIDNKKITPVYQQIKDEIVRLIGEKKFTRGSLVPSIHKLCAAHHLSAGTVVRAYDELRLAGVLEARQGKGYFVAQADTKNSLRIFLLFDRMNAYKEVLYRSIIDGLGPDTEVNVFFHHYDHKRFEKIIRDNLGKYSHYLVMPHLHVDTSKTLNRIPVKKLILIDGLVEGFNFDVSAVYQDFRNDICNSLREALPFIRKYSCLNLVISESPFQFVPQSCRAGFTDFVVECGFEWNIVGHLLQTEIKRNHFYIVFDDAELIWLLKEVDRNGWVIGKDVGVVSYDDTPVKEILHGGISVLTTDFRAMGQCAVAIIKGQKSGRFANRFQLISRGSF